MSCATGTTTYALNSGTIYPFVALCLFVVEAGYPRLDVPVLRAEAVVLRQSPKDTEWKVIIPSHNKS
jgi:hypothetical protein